MKELSIKEHPELRHALAHLYYALEALARGDKSEALYEIRSIEGLIFWDTDEKMTHYSERKYGMKKNCKGKGKKNCKGKKK